METKKVEEVKRRFEQIAIPKEALDLLREIIKQNSVILRLIEPRLIINEIEKKDET